MITVQQFRADFPEFVSTTMYPNSGIQFWLNFAYKMINAERFGDQLDVGAELFTAHFIVLEANAALTSVNGGIPGQSGGVLASKSVDKVSVSYDTGAGTEQGAGHWNLTNYGTRFKWMINMFGAGGLQLGIGSSNTSQPWGGVMYGHQ